MAWIFFFRKEKDGHIKSKDMMGHIVQLLYLIYLLLSDTSKILGEKIYHIFNTLNVVSVVAYQLIENITEVLFFQTRPTKVNYVDTKLKMSIQNHI